MQTCSVLCKLWNYETNYKKLAKQLWNYEISATTQEFILKKKVGPVQSITELSYCSINAALLNVYFMLH